MAGIFEPRAAVKELLQGGAPARPLFLPVVFSLAARVENVPLRAFLGNATKITNGLRQVRGHLRADAITCCFDPFLEAEALGAALDWKTDDGPAALAWPGRGQGSDGLPPGLRAPEDAATSGHVPVAVEVIKRMKATARDTLLMAAVTGPFTLAAHLSGDQAGGATCAALEVAGATAAAVARALLEAGVDVLVIREGDFGANLGANERKAGHSQTEVAVNIIRFYEALPILLLAPSARRSAAPEPGLGFDCIVCMEMAHADRCAMAPERCGLALPVESFRSEGEFAQMKQELQSTLEGMVPAVVTTSGDFPAAAKVKHLAEIGAAVMALR